MHRDMMEIGKYFRKAPLTGGFSMKDYWVWCGSVMKGEDERYHMFASRWPKVFPFHPGWGMASEIVRASSDTPEGPYNFEEVVLPARGAGYWDGRSTHNPVIQKCGDTYILFYTGISYPYPDFDLSKVLHQHSLEWLAARASKRIGIATSKSIYGPWERKERPILDVRPGYFDDFFTSNPAPCMHSDGSCLLVYKTRTYQKPPYQMEENMFSDMKLGVAWAEHYTKPFVRLTNQPLFSEKEGILEDPFIWQTSSGYAMIAKDWAGTYTKEVGAVAYANSTDGIHWNIAEDTCAFSREICWENGVTRTMGNMDRPFLLFDKEEATHLFVATNDGAEAGFKTMTHSWNACIPLK